MFKKLCSVLIFVIAFSVLSVPAFAASPDESVYSKDTPSTKDYFVTITKPEEEKDIIAYTTYAIAGTSKYDGVKVMVLKYDSDKDKYVRFADVDDESSWNMSEDGYFQRSFSLHKGANRFRIVATRANDERTQITDFVITRIENTLGQGINVFGNMFNPKK